MSLSNRPIRRGGNRRSGNYTPRTSRVVEDSLPLLAEFGYNEADIALIVQECDHNDLEIQQRINQLALEGTEGKGWQSIQKNKAKPPTQQRPRRNRDRQQSENTNNNQRKQASGSRNNAPASSSKSAAPSQEKEEAVTSAVAKKQPTNPPPTQAPTQPAAHSAPKPAGGSTWAQKVSGAPSVPSKAVASEPSLASPALSAPQQPATTAVPESKPSSSTTGSTWAKRLRGEHPAAAPAPAPPAPAAPVAPAAPPSPVVAPAAPPAVLAPPITTNAAPVAAVPAPAAPSTAATSAAVEAAVAAAIEQPPRSPLHVEEKDEPRVYPSKAVATAPARTIEQAPPVTMPPQVPTYRPAFEPSSYMYEAGHPPVNTSFPQLYQATAHQRSDYYVAPETDMNRRAAVRPPQNIEAYGYSEQTMGAYPHGYGRPTAYTDYYGAGPMAGAYGHRQMAPPPHVMRAPPRQNTELNREPAFIPEFSGYYNQQATYERPTADPLGGSNGTAAAYPRGRYNYYVADPTAAAYTTQQQQQQAPAGFTSAEQGGAYPDVRDPQAQYSYGMTPLYLTPQQLNNRGDYYPNAAATNEAVRSNAGDRYYVDRQQQQQQQQTYRQHFRY